MPGMTGYDLLKAIKVMHLIHFNMHNLIHVVNSAQYQKASWHTPWSDAAIEVGDCY
jgi:hypothetical protein